MSTQFHPIILHVVYIWISGYFNAVKVLVCFCLQHNTHLITHNDETHLLISINDIPDQLQQTEYPDQSERVGDC